MAEPFRIPRPQSAFLTQAGMPQTEWYNFLKGLYDLYQSSDTGVQAQITAIAYVLGSPDGTVANIPPLDLTGLPDTTMVMGLQSVLSFGTLADGQVVLTLLNDQENPGNSYYYGTSDAGVKGWHVLPEPPPRILPLVTGEIVSGQPVFVIADDGSLIYTEIE